MKKYLGKLSGALFIMLSLALAMTQSSSAATTPEHGSLHSPQSAPNAPTAAELWKPLPNKGLNGTVFAIAVMGNDAYVGGNFSGTADGSVTNLNKIAKYSNGAWSALPNNGLNGNVRALLSDGTDVYAAGEFSQTADGAVTNLGNIAKLSGGNWTALPNQGLDGTVRALAKNGDDLYVGGMFAKTGDSTVTDLGNVAKFDGAAWSALANKGLDGPVFALAGIEDDLYVAGDFDATGDGVGTNLNNIVIYSNGGWSGVPCNGFVNGSALDPEPSYVNVMAVSGSDLFVGGSFSGTRSCPNAGGNNFAYLTAGTWPAISQFGLDETVTTLAVNGSDVYAGGWFIESQLGQVKNLKRIAKFSNGTWFALPNSGLNNSVFALATTGDDVFVGGQFTRTADGRVKNLNNIALLKSCPSAPTAATLLAPQNNAVVNKTSAKLDWSDGDCAAYYKLKVKDKTTGNIVLNQPSLYPSQFKLKGLVRGHRYWWQVTACNGLGCVPSPKQNFRVKP